MERTKEYWEKQILLCQEIQIKWTLGTEFEYECQVPQAGGLALGIQNCVQNRVFLRLGFGGSKSGSPRCNITH